jgi:hypothetical protein
MLGSIRLLGPQGPRPVETMKIADIGPFRGLVADVIVERFL